MVLATKTKTGLQYRRRCLTAEAELYSFILNWAKPQEGTSKSACNWLLPIYTYASLKIEPV